MEVVFWLVPTPPVSGRGSGLRFSVPTAVKSGIEAQLSDPSGLSDPIRAYSAQQLENSDWRVVEFFHFVLSDKVPFLWSWFPLEFLISVICRETLQRSLSVYFSLATRWGSLLRWIMRAIASVDLEKQFLVSANVAAWWHINVIYRRVYVAGLVGHFIPY